MVACNNVVNALRFDEAQGFSEAVQQGDGGRIGNVARRVGRQLVLQIIVHPLQLRRLSCLESLSHRTECSELFRLHHALQSPRIFALRL